MLWYVSDFNGVLADLKDRVRPTQLTTPRNADTWVFWQDVLGSYGDLLEASHKAGFYKPTFTVQHGRAATSDYDKPNSFKFRSDWFLCWGKADYERMRKLGYGKYTKIVGCPLNTHIKPKVEHKEKVVLFVPVNTGKEEPENIAVYYELLKIKYEKAKIKVLELPLKDKWSLNGKAVSTNKLVENFDVVAKLLPWHDKALYHGNVVTGNQYFKSNNELVFSLLRNVDAVVGLDEGCTEIFAMAHDVPVIVVDGFKYRQHKPNGRSYEETDIYRTNGAVHCKLEDLKENIEFALAHPEYKREERRQVAEDEMGLSLPNPTETIYQFVKEQTKCLNPRS